MVAHSLLYAIAAPAPRDVSGEQRTGYGFETPTISYLLSPWQRRHLVAVLRSPLREPKQSPAIDVRASGVI
jgi:hypothetical protein